jgi:hypothetical protein
MLDVKGCEIYFPLCNTLYVPILFNNNNNNNNFEIKIFTPELQLL